MLWKSQEPITWEEKLRLKRTSRQPIISRLIKKEGPQVLEEGFVDVYKVSALECFIPSKFNEEMPFYLLNLGETWLALFGQWVFDPHTLSAPKATLDEWQCEQGFFKDFSLRCLARRGVVLHLSVTGTEILPARRLPPSVKFSRLLECQSVPRRNATLIEDLMQAGLVE